MSDSIEDAVDSFERIRLHEGGACTQVDPVAVEAPLEIRIDGVPIAVVMRTPGQDADLVWGFLRSEGIVTRREHVLSVRHCETVDDPRAEDNVMQVRVAAEAQVDHAALRRNLYASSSCGVCGKASMERAMATAAPRASYGVTPSLAQLRDLQTRLRRRQHAFDATGGLHAAGIANFDGELLVVREDVGRHNAVDKVIGDRFSTSSIPADPTLVVSGRVSFEIVQKALAAGIHRIVAVSAPTSLAIELAREARIGLIGFVRQDGANIYAPPPD